MSVNIKKYSAILLLLMYLMAEIGFGMHRCNIESTSYIPPALYSTDCKSGHKHELPSNNIESLKHDKSKSESSSCSSCQSGNESPNSDDGYFSNLNCCDNQFVSLDIDQLRRNLRSDIDIISLHLNFNYLNNSSISEYVINFSHYTHSPPVILNLRKILTLLSNWRL